MGLFKQVSCRVAKLNMNTGEDISAFSQGNGLVIAKGRKSPEDKGYLK